METAASVETPNPRIHRISCGEAAVRFAGLVASDGFPRGDLAALRRMNPDAPDATAFWRLMAQMDLSGSPAFERKWALVLHGLAIMTRASADSAASRSAHDRYTPVGQALFYGGNPERQTPYYSQSRLNRLLVARGTMLRTLLARMFRMMAAADQRFDWCRMALFILNDGYDEERADSERRSIARAYYRAESRAARSQT